jgi:uncharacterized repeat protein (TIGR01451 family)
MKLPSPFKKHPIPESEPPATERIEFRRRERGVGGLYDDQVVPDHMATFDRRPPKRRGMWVLFLIMILLILAGVSAFGFWVFEGRRKAEGERSVEVSVVAPERHASGDLVTYVITYMNRGIADLKEAQLQMRFPDGFTFIDATKESADGRAWDLGRVRSGLSGKITIRGQLIGEVNTAQRVFVTLFYRPSNFNYEFQQEASEETKINKSALDLSVDGPTRATGGQSVTYTIEVQNTAELDLKKIRVRTEVPLGFIVQKTSPAPKEEGIWEFETFKPGDKGKIEVTGTLSGQRDEQKNFVVTVGIVDETGQFHAQREGSALTLIVNPEVNLGLTANGKTEAVISLGDHITYEVTAENISDVLLKDVEIVVEFGTLGVKNYGLERLLDFNTLNDENHGKVEGNRIRWTKEQIAALGEMRPRAKEVFKFTLTVKPNLDVKIEDDREFALTATSRFDKMNTDDLPQDALKLQSSTATTKINTIFQLQAQGRYYSDEMEVIGSGPIPPVVGKTTTYRIVWNLTNTTNSVKDASIQTVLPASVVWEGRSSVSEGSALAFDVSTRTVTWNLATISAHTGSRLPELEAYFEVSVTPTSNDVGKLLALTGEQTVEATDSFTQTALSLTRPVITSDLKGDPLGANQGIVIEDASLNNAP